MTVYVTEARAPRSGRAARWARMSATSGTELDQAAAEIGVQPGFRFHGDATTASYYLISPQQRTAALAAGAVALAATLPAAAPQGADQGDLFADASKEGVR